MMETSTIAFPIEAYFKARMDAGLTPLDSDHAKALDRRTVALRKGLAFTRNLSVKTIMVRASGAAHSRDVYLSATGTASHRVSSALPGLDLGVDVIKPTLPNAVASPLHGVAKPSAIRTDKHHKRGTTDSHSLCVP
jgi:hypothetical protein